MKKSLLALILCASLTFLAGCDYNNQDVEKSSSEAVTSVPILSEVSSAEALSSSEDVPSEPISSEGTSSNSVVGNSIASEAAVKPTPPKATGSSGFIAKSYDSTVAAKVSDTKKFTSPAVKWQERPMKEPASTNWKVSHGTGVYKKEYTKGIYDADGDPVYSTGHLYFDYDLDFSSGNVEVGAPIAFYRYENGGWVLLNEKSANEITETKYLSPATESTIYTCTVPLGDNILTKGGKYMAEKQMNGKLVSFKFSVVENEKWDATWERPPSTNATVTFEKDAYPIGTEAIPVTLNTGNGEVGGGGLLIALYKLENDEWKALYRPIPQTVGILHEQDTIYNDQARVKGYLDEAGKYKLRAYYAEGVENELIFTVE